MNQKAKSKSDISYSIINGEPISTDSQFMDKEFSNNRKKEKSMLNKIIGRAFLMVIPLLCLPTMAHAVGFAAPLPALAVSNSTASMILGNSGGGQSFGILQTIMNMVNKLDNHGAVDLARDTGLRYLGYANETGESFKFIFPKLLRPSYTLAYGYCLSDALYKSLHFYFDHGQVFSSGLVKTFADAMIFQCFASVLIPGNIIAFFVENTEKKLHSMKKVDPRLVKWLPVFVGMITIPFIIHPIDFSVDFIMNHTIRVLYRFF